MPDYHQFAMIQENEVIMLVLGVGVLIFIISNYARLKPYPSIHILIAGFCFSLLGWSLTVAEGFLLGATLNVAEHLCYLFSVLCIALWLHKAFVAAKETD